MGWLSEPMGLVLVALVTVAGSWLTTKASTRAAQRTTEQTVIGQLESTKAQAEEQAFQRAKEFYVGVIEEQRVEIGDQRGEINDLKRELADQKATQARQAAELEQCKRTCRALLRRTGGDPDAEV